jgi:hypothetical protein
MLKRYKETDTGDPHTYSGDIKKEITGDIKRQTTVDTKKQTGDPYTYSGDTKKQTQEIHTQTQEI